MQLFARITKVDEASRTVEGVIADETPDKSGEIFDYAKSKPHFLAWSEGIAKATEGKNLGNVRVMHGNTVAGVTKELNFDDAAKAIAVKAHIADDNEWNKTLAGCYTGFSIGGRYGAKWDDGNLKRYEAIPSEYSLVDLPCNPSAQFTVIKADGSQELRKFEADGVSKAAANLFKAATKSEPVASAIGALIGKPLAKDMYSVSWLADLLNQLGYVADDAEWEAKWEGDGSTVPDDLRAAVKSLAAILVRMANEEATEMEAALNADKAAAATELKKQHEDDAMNVELQKAHDEAKAELAKVSGELATANDALAKASGERDELAKSLATITAERDELNKGMEQIKAELEKIALQPAPAKGVARVVEKTLPGGDPEPEPDDKPVLKADGSVDGIATAQKLAKLAYRAPVSR